MIADSHMGWLDNLLGDNSVWSYSNNLIVLKPAPTT